MYDLIGAGFGPSNIALAIALEEKNVFKGSQNTVFLERQSTSEWHPGMLLPGSTLQVAFLKDLVTLRNPTSPYSFLNYLKTQGRLDEFVNLRTFFPGRYEFSDYIQWVAAHFKDLVRYNEKISRVTPITDGGKVTNLSVITDSGEEFMTQAFVAATGGEPSIPSVFESLLGSRVFHSSEYMWRMPSPEDIDEAVVVVMGSGQSAAEIVHHLISAQRGPEVIWIIRDYALRPMDDTKFVNEVFFPSSVDFFFSLPEERRRQFIRSVRTANYSAVDVDLIDQLYRLIYEGKFSRPNRLRVVAHAEVEKASENDESIQIAWRNRMTEERGVERAHYAVLATGFLHDRLPSYLAPLRHHVLESEGRPIIDRNYQLRCRPTFEPRIFVQGFAEHTHGIADTLLSICAHRAGIIADELTWISNPVLDLRTAVDIELLTSDKHYAPNGLSEAALPFLSHRKE